MTPSNNKADNFWKQIFEANSLARGKQEQKILEVIQTNLINGNVPTDVSDESYLNSVKNVRQSMRTKKTMGYIATILLAIIFVGSLVTFLLINGGVMANPLATPTFTPTITLVPPTPTATSTPTPIPTPTPLPTSMFAILPENMLDLQLPVTYDQIWTFLGDQFNCDPASGTCNLQLDVPFDGGNYILFYKNDATQDSREIETFVVNSVNPDGTATELLPLLGSGTAYLANNTQLNEKYSLKEDWVFVGEYEVQPVTTLGLSIIFPVTDSPRLALVPNEVVLVRITEDQATLLANLAGKGTLYTIQERISENDASPVIPEENAACWNGSCNRSTIQKVYFAGQGVMAAGKYHVMIFNPLLDASTALTLNYYQGNNINPIANLALTPVEGMAGWYQTESFELASDGQLWFKITGVDSAMNPVDFPVDVLFVLKDAE